MGERNADSAMVMTEAMPEGSSSLGVVHFEYRCLVRAGVMISRYFENFFQAKKKLNCERRQPKQGSTNDSDR